MSSATSSPSLTVQSSSPELSVPASHSTALEQDGSNASKEHQCAPSSNEHPFGQFTHFVDQHLQFVRAGIVIMGLTGVVMVGRSLRMMKTFCSVADIPEEFIRKQMRLRGKVRGHTKGHLQVEHLPIIKGKNFIGGSRESSLPVYLAGVDLSEANMSHLVNLAPEESLLWFRMLGVNQQQGLECIVTRKKNFLLSMNVNEHLVRQGLAKVQPPDPSQGLSPLAADLVRRLFKAELHAEERAKGMWVKPSLWQRSREKVVSVQDGMKARVKRGLQAGVRPFTASVSVVRSLGTSIKGLFRSGRSSR